jgi:hypothetical protein
MAISPTSQIAFNAIKDKLEALEQEIWLALDELGPVHDLRLQEYLIQKEKLKPKNERRIWPDGSIWPINAVTPRRGALEKKGQVEFAGYYRCLYNGKTKIRKFWRLSSDKREPAGWTKLTPDEVTAMKNSVKSKKSVKVRMTASDFGRALVMCRHNKKYQVNQNQAVLF